jgi:AsmA family protein
MNGSQAVRFCLKLTVRALAVLFAALVVLAAALLIVASHLREPLIRFVSARTHRQIQVAGSLEAHLLSLHPRLTAERVVIGNPPWMAPGVTAEIGRLTIVYDLPLPGQSFGIRRLEMEATTLRLARDANGHANWQWQDPDTGPGQGPPLIRSLWMPAAHVFLDDARRHLRFDGTVTAGDVPGPGDVHPLRIVGSGQLNGRAANLVLNGDPLATVRQDHPYGFAFTADSSGSLLTGRGSVPRPFDFLVLETTFDSAGEDMKDLYFLTGVNLPDTGAYRLSGKLSRQRAHFEFSDLAATSGRSDMRGTISVEAKGGRSRTEAELRSQLLRVTDLGPRAAGRASEAAGDKPLLLPDKRLKLDCVRYCNALVRFHAQAVEAGHVTLHAVAAKVDIENGVAAVDLLSASLADGKINGVVKLDATREIPLAEMDLKVAHLPLGELAHKNDDKDSGPAPIDGPLHARIALKGHGRSIHELAASANGTATAVLPHGAVRVSMAELAGVDFRGLGLMATRNKEDTDIRCALASFQVSNGVLTTDRLLIDTEPVLITGEGTVRLDTEDLDLVFQGRPKHPRLRLRAPVLVRGTLRHPSFSIEARKPAVQAGAAVALGMLLTPVAAVLAFVDPGLAKDTDCTELLAEARVGAHPDRSAPSP